MIDFLPDWLEILIFLLASMISGAIGGFLGIFLAARSEIMRNAARAERLKIAKEKRDGQV